MVPDLPAEWRAEYDAIKNMGICCLVFKLKRSVSPNFWVNISEPDISVPGLIEFSNPRPLTRVQSCTSRTTCQLTIRGLRGLIRLCLMKPLDICSA
jgi:hypothetical protein